MEGAELLLLATILLRINLGQYPISHLVRLILEDDFELSLASDRLNPIHRVDVFVPVKHGTMVTEFCRGINVKAYSIKSILVLAQCNQFALASRFIVSQIKKYLNCTVDIDRNEDISKNQ